MLKQNKITHFRWLIVGLLFFTTLLNYIDRASIGYAIDEMAQAFHLTDGQMGLILGAFGIGYLITTFLGGIAADRYGARITLLLAVLLWSLSLVFTGLTTGFLMAFIMRALLGVAEGPSFPAMTRAIGDWLPPKEEVRALSSALIAVPFALAIGGPIVSFLIVHFSWRLMFFILGAAAFLWLPVWWFLFRDFPDDSPHVTQEELALIHEAQAVKPRDTAEETQRRKNVKGVWRFLFSNTTLLANYWAFFVFGYFLFFFMSWLPTYLRVHYHLHLEEVGLFTVLPWGLSVFSMWGVGYLSDHILKRTGNYRLSRSYPIWISQLVAALCVIPVVYTNNVNVAMLFISLAVACNMSANATYFATNIDVAKVRAGTALGIMDALFAISGFLAPVITGWIVTVTTHFTSAFVLLSVLALSSVIVVFFFHHPESSERLT